MRRCACRLMQRNASSYASRGRSKEVRARKAVRYEVSPGARKALRFRLKPKRLRALRRTGSLSLTARARNRDAAGGTPSAVAFTVGRR